MDCLDLLGGRVGIGDTDMSEVNSEPRVFMRHIRQAKLCAQGTRTWWKDNGLDWNDFLKNGIAGERLIATGDPLALRPVEAARIERDGQ